MSPDRAIYCAESRWKEDDSLAGTVKIQETATVLWTREIEEVVTVLRQWT